MLFQLLFAILMLEQLVDLLVGEQVGLVQPEQQLIRFLDLLYQLVHLLENRVSVPARVVLGVLALYQISVVAHGAAAEHLHFHAGGLRILVH